MAGVETGPKLRLNEAAKMFDVSPTCRTTLHLKGCDCLRGSEMPQNSSYPPGSALHGRAETEGGGQMKTLEPIGDYKPTILDDRLRKLLSSRKQRREFRSVAGYYRNQPVLHAAETELNREFGKRGTARRNWF